MPPRVNHISVRDALLNAAETVASKEGVARLTFDAVAAEAGVSKGGLLHHFTNKDQLIEAMVRRTAEGWRGYYTAALQSVPEGPGRLVRGLLKSCLTDAEQWTEDLRRSFSSVFAALAQNPALVEPMREAYVEFFQLVEADGLPDGLAEVLTTAIDGMWFYWVLRLRPVDQGALDRMRTNLEGILTQALEALAKESPVETTTSEKP